MALSFNWIRWRNFLSTGNDWTEIGFDKSQSTLIIGQNGSGKSTLLDALCYVLYGKPFRKINIPQLPNTINGKGMCVEVEFLSGRDKFLVRRGLKPNIFEVEKNGVLVNQDAANKDYQDVLTKYILKMNMKAFCQVVILGSASFVPFMQLPAGHRRDILEDLLDIQIFTTMNLLLKERVAENSKELIEIDYKLEMVKEKIRLHEEHKEKMLSSSQDIIDDLEESIKKTERDILSEEKILEEKRTALSALITQTADYDRLTKKMSEFHRLHSQIAEKVNGHESMKKFFVDHDNCPTCKQMISDAFRKESIDSRDTSISELKDAMGQLVTREEDMRTKIAAMKSVLDTISSMNVDINIRTGKIKSHQSAIAGYRSQIAKIAKKNEVISVDDTASKGYEDELEKISNTKRELFDTKELYKVATAILKDSGIKSKIIKQYVPVINKLINKYLAAMDFFVQFELDENFNETIKSRFRDAFSYASFSEGEKSKIDLALLFTWRTIARLRNSASTNILILDEVFDGSLDAGSSEELLKILIELSNDSNIIVISHRTDQLLDKFDRVIKFEKKSNFSRMSTEEREEA